MKSNFVLLAAALVIVGESEARLGETEAEIEARYGKPYQEKDEGLRGQRRYYKAGRWTVNVWFKEGKSAEEHYLVGGAFLTAKEMISLIEANGGGDIRLWNLPRIIKLNGEELDYWTRKDGKACAYVNHEYPGLLTLRLGDTEAEAKNGPVPGAAPITKK